MRSIDAVLDHCAIVAHNDVVSSAELSSAINFSYIVTFAAIRYQHSVLVLTSQANKMSYLVVPFLTTNFFVRHANSSVCRVSVKCYKDVITGCFNKANSDHILYYRYLTFFKSYDHRRMLTNFNEIVPIIAIQFDINIFRYIASRKF